TLFFFFFFIPPPPISTLFPYTTLFRSLADAAATRQPDPFLETRTGLADARAGIYLPTGTQVFLSGGVAYNDTNFTREEYEGNWRSEEHTSELQSRENLVCRLLLEKKKI